MKRIITALLMAAALAAPMMILPGVASAQMYVGISVGYAPPPLPWYPQPICPSDGYIWAPGYWSYSPYGYYWVPGTWVLAPVVGLLWTPGYWAWDGGFYWWNPGYWSPNVGYYGGINYGYGYAGIGYFGGYWRRGAFYYNRAVSNVNVTYIHNTYNQTVINNYPAASRVSYNGGEGGVPARPTPTQLEYAREPHVALTAMQLHQERLALANPAQRFTVNQGRPQIAATPRPGVFTGAGVVRMNAEQSGYIYSGKARPLPPNYQNGARVEREPQEQPARPNVKEYRPTARPASGNYTAPVREVNPRPAPPPAVRKSEHRPQPPVMGFDNSYASAYRPPVRADADQGGWNVNRSEMPRPQQFSRAPIRQASWSAPHVQARAPAGNSGGHDRDKHGRPPR